MLLVRRSLKAKLPNVVLCDSSSVERLSKVGIGETQSTGDVWHPDAEIVGSPRVERFSAVGDEKMDEK